MGALLVFDEVGYDFLGQKTYPCSYPKKCWIGVDFVKRQKQGKERKPVVLQRVFILP